MATLTSVDAFPPTFQGRSEDDARTGRRWFALRRGEPAAAVALEGTGQWLPMVRDGICRLTGVSDFPVLCREGTLWITSPEDLGDTVVAAGEQLSVTSLGTILVVALAPSSMWVPRGFAVDDGEGSSKRRMSRIFPVSTDAADAPRPFLHRAFHRVVAALARCGSTGPADARERHLSRSVDHADFENRLRTWDEHEARLRCLSSVL